MRIYAALVAMTRVCRQKFSHASFPLGLQGWRIGPLQVLSCSGATLSLRFYYASAAAPMFSSTTHLTIARRFVSLPHRATAGAVFGALWNMCVARVAPSNFLRHAVRIYLSHRANDDGNEMKQPLGTNG